MRAIKRQYFLAFAVMGCVLPYLPVYLSARGLDDVQIGYVTSTLGVAILLTPVLLTLLADVHLESRTLIGLVFALSAAALAWLLGAGVFWTILSAHLLFALAFTPVSALQDGLNFGVRRRLLAAGKPAAPYHRVRVFGTIGFMVPSLALYWLLDWGWPVAITLAAGVVCALLGVLNATWLPTTRRHRPQVSDREGLPTLAAARAMLEPHVLVFCVAMWLVHLSTAAYYTFYPLYLTRLLDIDAKWIGLIANLGVAVEVFFMLGFGRLLRRLGLRGLMAIGVGCMVVRFALLCFAPSVAVAIGVQVFHGMMVLVVHVAPPIYLNHRAGDAYRNSIQGLFAMSVAGSGRIVGNVAAGYVAAASLTGVFGYAAGLCLIAAGLFAFAFHDRHDRQIEP